MNKNIKKIGKAVAGSALLVGATLTGAAGLASAASGAQDLGDYPTPFVDDDGEVQSTVVVGESAKTVDVVGAINVAGSLGNAAFSTETKQVSVSGAGGSWSASNGVTLDTRNDNLFYGQTLDSVRSTLTQSDLDVLSETTFRDDSSTTYDLSNYLNVGTEPVTFGNGADELDNEDPEVHVPLTSENNVDSSSYVYNLQTSMDSINFGAEDVAGEDIELFGREYTVAEDNFDRADNNNNDDEFIKLYGSQEETELATGESTTMTIDGEEVTLEVVSVDSSNDDASITVDGRTESYGEGDSFTPTGSDTEVRIDDLVNQGATDDGQGIVRFQVGSEELRLYQDDNIQDADNDDYEGTYVQINGGGSEWTSLGDGVSSLDVYVGAEDDDEDALVAGETFSHSLFENVEVHFGGLNPDAMSDEDSTEELNVAATGGGDNVEVSFTTRSGESTSLTFADDGTASSGDTPNNLDLADSDGDAIHTVEGAAVSEDEYFTADPGDFTRMWEVTEVDYESTASDSVVEVTDKVTGQSYEVDGFEDQDEYSVFDQGDREIIDGQEYYFHVDSSNEVQVTWGDGAAVGNSGDEVSTFSRLDTESGAALSLYAPADLSDGVFVTDFQETNTIASGGLYSNTGDTSDTLTLYTDNSNSATLQGYAKVRLTQGSTTSTVEVTDGSANFGETFDTTSGHAEIDVEILAADGTGDISIDASTGDGGPSVTSITSASETVEVPSTQSTDAQTLGSTVSFSDTTTLSNPNSGTITSGTQLDYALNGGDLELDQGLSGVDSDNDADTPSVIVHQPEDDSDEEHAYVFKADYDADDGDDTGVQNIVYTGQRDTQDLESDDNVNAGVDFYGAYSEYNSDTEGEATLYQPAGQATVGAAVTGAEGELSAEGGGSGSVETSSPTGWPDAAALDSDSNIDSLKTSNEMILVGGPSVNALTQELADDDKTMAASEYEEGTAIVQMVNNAFAEGQDALVVSGYAGEDTREAANYVANYADHQEEMAGKQKVELTTQQTQNAE